MKIDVVTIVSNRLVYFNRLLQSIRQLGGHQKIRHHIVYNGKQDYDVDLSSYDQEVKIYRLQERRIVGDILNIVKPNLDSDLTMKMDEDAIIRSPNFFDHVEAIHTLKPDAVFSPFPVGLIGNFGGIQSTVRHVEYSNLTDTYYTFRRVDHVGGFARIAPTKYIKNFTVRRLHDEDTNFSENHRHVEFYYLENALIIEHQESTMGQNVRYAQYFKEKGY